MTFSTFAIIKQQQHLWVNGTQFLNLKSVLRNFGKSTKFPKYHVSISFPPKRWYICSQLSNGGVVPGYLASSSSGSLSRASPPWKMVTALNAAASSISAPALFYIHYIYHGLLILDCSERILKLLTSSFFIKHVLTCEYSLPCECGRTNI